ncbi:MAG: TolC family protein [Phaeodactylibacter sp.]|uniref:TolC family protein n=1 Tax=Phaeodactylibacter sp. TaxID=1940289 RepID=UPI0032EE58E2
MTTRKIALTLALCALTSWMVQAQTQPWSLEKCIEYARQNNLNLRQAQYDIRTAELGVQENQYSRLPGLSAGARAGYQFGRTIDPTTNSFNNERIGFNSFSLDANVTLYSGGFINNSIRQGQLNTRAAKLDADATSNNIALDIAAAYLNILLSEEQLTNAKQNLKLTEDQLSQTDKLIRAGSVPANDRLDLLSQIAQNDRAIIEAENAVNIGYLNLKQLMQLGPQEDLKIVRPEFIDLPANANPQAVGLEEVYTAALQTQPQIQAADLRIESAQLSEEIAKSGFLPTLTLFASLNSNFSSAFRSPIFETRRVPQTVFIDGSPVTIEFESEVPVDNEQIAYTDQIDQNFGQVVGVNLNVPIYSRHTNRINQERARLSKLNAEVGRTQQRQLLEADVQRALADTRASFNSYKAAQRSVEAAETAFENAQKRFDLGAINTLEFATARNTLDQARIELIRSKYQYLFNLKTIDFYMGKALELD